MLDVLMDWQTLATGALAIFAAWIAARPVWRQLQRMETQSNVMLREMLSRRVSELEARRESVQNAVREPLDKINTDLAWWHEDTDDIDEHWAFNMSQLVAGALGRFARFRAAALDDQNLEALKSALVEKMSALADLLDQIHRPASTQQHDEDYSISDEDWAKIIQRGQEARAEVPSKYSDARGALNDLDEAYASKANEARARIVGIDQRLLA